MFVCGYRVRMASRVVLVLAAMLVASACDVDYRADHAEYERLRCNGGPGGCPDGGAGATSSNAGTNGGTSSISPHDAGGAAQSAEGGAGSNAGGAGGASATGGAMAMGGTATGGTTATGGMGGNDAGGSGGTGASCDGLAPTCGANSDEDSCASLSVPGGSFQMGRSTSGTDAYASGGTDEVPEHTVTVSTFVLDKFEVTVGRLRKFVEAGAPEPAAG